jgi:hypothetical protein
MLSGTGANSARRDRVRLSRACADVRRGPPASRSSWFAWLSAVTIGRPFAPTPLPHQLSEAGCFAHDRTARLLAPLGFGPISPLIRN